MTAAIKYLDSDGGTQVSTEVLADIFAGINDTPKKLGFESLSDRILNLVSAGIIAAGNSDGFAQLRLSPDTATLTHPYGPGNGGAPTSSVSAPGVGGVFGAIGTYGYVLTATNATGETIASAEVTATITATTQKVTITWVQVVGATGYKLYRTPTPGSYGASTLRATIGSGATITFLDDGSATSAGTPPLVNTSGGWAPTVVVNAPGSGGSFSGTGTYFYRITALDSTGQILAASYEVSAVITNVTQTVALTWTAVVNAVSYNIYRTTSAGTYNTPALRANAGASPFTDTGGALIAGALTKAASYGIPPATILTDLGPIAYTAVPINQQNFFWITRVVPIATAEVGNPRVASLLIQET